MTQNLHSMEMYKNEAGKFGFRIKMGDDVVAGDMHQGYENEKDCLQALFGQFFGEWDETFLGLYNKWQGYAGTAYDIPPEAQEGIPVQVRRKADAPDPEQHMEQMLSEAEREADKQAAAQRAGRLDADAPNYSAGDEDVVVPGGDNDGQE